MTQTHNLELNSIKGLNCITRQMLQRLTTEHLSRNELQLFIHLTHIADRQGLIQGFTSKEIINVCNCSKQGAYEAMRGLERKHFVSLSHIERGYYNISLADISTKNGFISSQIEFLYSKSWLYALDKLKARASMMYLYLVDKYNYATSKNTEIKISLQKLKEVAGVERLSKVREYLAELAEYIGINYTITDGIVSFDKSYCYVPTHELDSYHTSYMRRSIDKFCISNGLAALEADAEALAELHNVVYGLVKNAINLQGICDTITQTLRTHKLYAGIIELYHLRI